jgi:hypothetical protein
MKEHGEEIGCQMKQRYRILTLLYMGKSGLF